MPTTHLTNERTVLTYFNIETYFKQLSSILVYIYNIYIYIYIDFVYACIWNQLSVTSDVTFI